MELIIKREGLQKMMGEPHNCVSVSKTFCRVGSAHIEGLQVLIDILVNPLFVILGRGQMRNIHHLFNAFTTR